MIAPRYSIEQLQSMSDAELDRVSNDDFCLALAKSLKDQHGKDSDAISKELVQMELAIQRVRHKELENRVAALESKENHRRAKDKSMLKRFFLDDVAYETICCFEKLRSISGGTLGEEFNELYLALAKVLVALHGNMDEAWKSISRIKKRQSVRVAKRELLRK